MPSVPLLASLADQDASQIAGASAALVPSGVVLPYSGVSAPSGWLFCFGQAVSRTVYANLFSALSTTYGTGDGSTTFNLPDMRGRVAAGRDDMGGSAVSRITSGGAGIVGTTLGASGGAETHALTTAQLASHSHFVKDVPTGAAGATALYPAAGSTRDRGTPTNTTIDTATAGSGSAHQNTQPTIILNYIIKV